MKNNPFEKTNTSISIEKIHEMEIENLIKEISESLVKKGYKPVNQFAGYILSDDPTYITSFNNARSKIRKVTRDELLKFLIKGYFEEMEKKKK